MTDLAPLPVTLFHNLSDSPAFTSITLLVQQAFDELRNAERGSDDFDVKATGVFGIRFPDFLVLKNMQVGIAFRVDVAGPFFQCWWLGRR